MATALGGSEDENEAEDAKAGASKDSPSLPGKGGGSAVDAGFSSPYDDPDGWGRFYLDQLEFPGIVVTVDGCVRPYEWAAQKATDKGGASLNFKGEKTAEGIEIECELPDTASFAALYVFRDTIKPAQGQKPPTLPLTNPIVNFNGIKAVVLEECGQPMYQRDRHSWTVKIKFKEDLPPKPAATGVADPAKPAGDGPANVAAKFGSANGGESPGDAAAGDSQKAALAA